MADDYYATLGVGRSASDEEIQSAYRQLARKYHPDLNPDDDKAKAKFQEVQNAFEVLNDPKKREMYDRYGSAYESMGGGGPGAGGPQPWAGAGGGPQVDIDFEDLFGGGGGGGFADLFKNLGGRGKRATRRAAPRRGSNINYELTVPFTSAVLGGEAQIAVQRHDGRTETIQVKIPAGIDDGKRIRLRGQGNPSPDGGPDGDLMIRVKTGAHPYFRRQGKRLDVWRADYSGRSDRRRQSRCAHSARNHCPDSAARRLQRHQAATQRTGCQASQGRAGRSVRRTRD